MQTAGIRTRAQPRPRSAEPHTPAQPPSAAPGTAMRASTVAPFSGQTQGALQRQQQCVRVSPAAAAAACRPRRAPAAPQCSQQPQPAAQTSVQPSRRALLALPAGLAAAAGLSALGAAAPRAAAAFVIPPPGYRYHEDKLDGYAFFYPEDWQPVTVGAVALMRAVLLAPPPAARPAPRAWPCPPWQRRRLRLLPPAVAGHAAQRHTWCSITHPCPADLWQRCVLPEPFQRGGERVCQRLLTLLLQVSARRGGAPARAACWPAVPGRAGPARGWMRRRRRLCVACCQLLGPSMPSCAALAPRPPAARYESVADLGSPEEAAKKTEQQVGAGLHRQHGSSGRGQEQQRTRVGCGMAPRRAIAWPRLLLPLLLPHARGTWRSSRPRGSAWPVLADHVLSPTTPPRLPRPPWAVPGGVHVHAAGRAAHRRGGLRHAAHRARRPPLLRHPDAGAHCWHRPSSGGFQRNTACRCWHSRVAPPMHRPPPALLLHPPRPSRRLRHRSSRTRAATSWR